MPLSTTNATLLKACSMGDRLQVERLLSQGADPRAMGEDGQSALHCAAWGQDIDILRMLLPLCDPKAKDRIGQTALMESASRLHLEGVELLLPVSDPLARDATGASALRNALWAREIEDAVSVARALLPHSNLREIYGGRTHLMDACLFGGLGLVELLMPVSDLRVRDPEGRSASELLASSHPMPSENLPGRWSALVERLAAMEQAAEIEASLGPAPASGRRAGI